uniref:Cysteine alpha-hairpin motif superfamily n=1 Tax=Steinernema glaseri TaxID=37863 RepID=A0A1I7Y889_9BILA
MAVSQNLMSQTATVATLLFLCFSAGFAAENEACEKLIECEAQAKAKWESCSVANSSAEPADHHEHACHNFTAALHDEVHALAEQKASFYAGCLKRLSPNASDFPLKGKKKAKCVSTKKNPLLKRSEPKSRRAASKKEKKNGSNAQKQCFKDVKKLRAKCHQLAKCCPIAKKCRDTSDIDKQIAEKKRALHEAHKECRRQRQGKKKNGAHKKSHKKEGGRPQIAAVDE